MFLSTAVTVWRLPSFFSQPRCGLFNANAHTLHLGWVHPNSHTTGLPGRRGRGRAGGLCSGCVLNNTQNKERSKQINTVQNTLQERSLDVFSILCSPGVPRNLRNDLLVAADSITNTMSSLVKELHSGWCRARRIFFI